MEGIQYLKVLRSCGQEETFQELQGPRVGEAEEMEIILSRTFVDQIRHCVSILRVMEARESGLYI